MTDSITDKIRRQFDYCPYPKVPLEESPAEDADSLYVHNMATSRYMRDQSVIDPQGRSILEVGCGSGYNALILAHANPGARIVAVDLSEKSIEVAEERLRRHGFTHCEFHVMNLEELPRLNQQFDAINCDEVLYLVPDPAAGLCAMKNVLKPRGIIRANLHSKLQRNILFQAQDAFRILGLFEHNPTGAETAAVREIMESLYDGTHLKQSWNSQRAAEDQWILSNYLIQGDQGYTIPDVFAFLDRAELEFISMVHWQTWNLSSLFREIPEFMVQRMSQSSIQDQLHLFELIHPIHRLLDFWCGHPSTSKPARRENWSDDDWRGATVFLHPQLRTEERRQKATRCIEQQQPFLINETIQEFDPLWIESSHAAVLLPLWEDPRSVSSLVERWRKIRPLQPATLEPTSESEAFQSVKKMLVELEYPAFVMLAR